MIFLIALANVCTKLMSASVKTACKWKAYLSKFSKNDCSWILTSTEILFIPKHKILAYSAHTFHSRLIMLYKTIFSRSSFITFIWFQSKSRNISHTHLQIFSKTTTHLNTSISNKLQHSVSRYEVKTHRSFQTLNSIAQFLTFCDVTIQQIKLIKSIYIPQTCCKSFCSGISDFIPAQTELVYLHREMENWSWICFEHWGE